MRAGLLTRPSGHLHPLVELGQRRQVGDATSVTSSTGTNFGFETIFGSTEGTVGHKQIATRVVLAEAGTVTSITAYIDEDHENVFGQLYLRDGSAVSEWKTEWRVMKWVEIATPAMLPSPAYGSKAERLARPSL